MQELLYIYFYTFAGFYDWNVCVGRGLESVGEVIREESQMRMFSLSKKVPDTKTPTQCDQLFAIKVFRDFRRNVT
jgi:hypothetical protein